MPVHFFRQILQSWNKCGIPANNHLLANKVDRIPYQKILDLDPEDAQAQESYLRLKMQEIGG